MIRPPSEADQGSMAGYDPNLGLGQQGMAQATRLPPQQPFNPQSIRPIQLPLTNVGSTIPMQGQMQAIQNNLR